MAAAWRGAWRWAVASTNRGGGGGDPVQPPLQHAMVDHRYVDDNCGASSTALAATSSSSNSALGRWLSELQVSWVLHLAQVDAASAGRTFVSRRLQHTARSWVLALHAISRSVASFTGWCSSQELQQEEALPWPPASEFVGFIAATFLLVLPFVDAVVALDDVICPASTSISSDDHGHGHGGIVSGNKGAVASAHKFRTLTDVRDALSGVFEQVQLWHSCLSSSSSPDAEAARISAEMIRLLSAKLDKVDEAMRNTRDCIRTHFIYNHLVDPPIAYDEASRSEKNASSSTSLNTVIIRSLEESLTRVSQSFPDQSLRFLFLANNFYFLWHQLLSQNLLLDVPTDALARKIDKMQVS
ncbi:unnamed protein product [Miscanthus lutarioriparius]|uniref:Exocyst subunit Exo70 family protein n=1 Tax=Miscanthus lutarioriparius TaxID=422564 RepID=A0A811S2M6_9POAL|nr:unnamed protein product [Miscanthus lutarioriparius]